MISEGRRLYSEVAIVKTLKELDQEKVERGKVYIKPLYSSKNIEMSMLYLSPGAKVREHKHTVDSEIYEEVDGKYSEVCNKGESHSLENSSTHRWLVILSVKRRWCMMSGLSLSLASFLCEKYVNSNKIILTFNTNRYKLLAV